MEYLKSRLCSPWKKFGGTSNIKIPNPSGYIPSWKHCRYEQLMLNENVVWTGKCEMNQIRKKKKEELADMILHNAKFERSANCSL